MKTQQKIPQEEILSCQGVCGFISSVALQSVLPWFLFRCLLETGNIQIVPSEVGSNSTGFQPCAPHREQKHSPGQKGHYKDQGQ